MLWARLHVSSTPVSCNIRISKSHLWIYYLLFFPKPLPKPKPLSSVYATIPTSKILIDYGFLWQQLKVCPHCRRKVTLSQKSATVAVVSQKTARQRRQSHFSATAWTGLKARTRSVSLHQQRRRRHGLGIWWPVNATTSPKPRTLFCCEFWSCVVALG